MNKIIAMLALVSAMLISPAPAVESSEWKKWNVSPFATTYVEACQNASFAINGLTMPPEVREHFKSTLGDLCEGGMEVWLVPGTHLEQMWSGKSGKNPTHVMNSKTVGELPVSKSPDGRPYRKNAVAETARAYSWEFVHEGKKYILYLPFVCFNWSWALKEVPTPPPAPVQEKERCKEIVFSSPPNAHVRWGAITTSGPLRPSECNAQRQGAGEWKQWYGICAECVTTDYSVFSSTLGGGEVQVPHKFVYRVTGDRQVLRFSADAVSMMVVYICLNDKGIVEGKQIDLGTCGVYVRPEDWVGRDQVRIDKSMWNWDLSKCPEFS